MAGTWEIGVMTATGAAVPIGIDFGGSGIKGAPVDLEKGEFAISAHLDLHGMPFEDARRAVDEFLVQQQKRGRRCVLIVTGKGKNSPNGQGVLRERVPEWLARGPSSRRVLAFASARPCDGGVGRRPGPPLNLSPRRVASSPASAAHQCDSN